MKKLTILERLDRIASLREDWAVALPIKFETNGKSFTRIYEYQDESKRCFHYDAERDLIYEVNL